ncbi:MAG TPA: hypothetical protein VKE22_12675, partial [Haliangiales bacterium]|nr:hypothetical protein [Haliangiales bacterium]
MTGRATCVGALVACAACGAAKVPAAHVPDAGPTPAAAAPAPRPPRLAGVPHTQAIRGATLAPDGRAALTVDGRGSVRLWTALDGTAAPAAVALREVQDLSIVAAPGGFAVGTVDATGTARLSRVSPDGAVAEVAVVPPFPPAEAIEVLPDGRFVVLGTDRRLDLYDATGHRTAALERAAFHATRMVRAGA